MHCGRLCEFRYDFVDDDGDASDCNGHGTHVASSAVGLSVGVAKGANVVGVRVLDCEGDGKIRNVIAGVRHPFDDQAASAAV
jgi:subtilisin family serine protease